MITCTRVPQKNCASYLAAKAMLTRPPLTPQEIFELADFGPVKSRMTKLSVAIRNGWLIELPGGRMIVSEFAQEHFNAPAPEPEYEGQLATPRVNVNAGLPLSAKYRPNPRGLRPDAMDNSRTAMPSVYAKVAP